METISKGVWISKSELFTMVNNAYKKATYYMKKGLDPKDSVYRAIALKALGGAELSEYLYDQIKEDSTDDNIEKEIERISKNQYFDFSDWKAVARHFANWQKQQMENNRITHCDTLTEEEYNLETGFVDQHIDKYNRMPTYLDAIEYGKQLQKQEFEEGHIEANK